MNGLAKQCFCPKLGESGRRKEKLPETSGDWKGPSLENKTLWQSEEEESVGCCCSAKRMGRGGVAWRGHLHPKRLCQSVLYTHTQKHLTQEHSAFDYFPIESEFLPGLYCVFRWERIFDWMMGWTQKWYWRNYSQLKKIGEFLIGSKYEGWIKQKLECVLLLQIFARTKHFWESLRFSES